MNDVFDLLLMAEIGIGVSIVDSKEFRIPDSVIAAGLLCLLLQSLAGLRAPTAVFLGATAAAAQTLLVRRSVPGGFGLGDVKYSILLGGFLGFWPWQLAIFLTAAIIFLVALPGIVRDKIFGKDKIPFSPYITMSAIAVRIAMEQRI